MVTAQPEARLAVVEVRTSLALVARTFDGFHVAAIASGKNKISPCFSSKVSQD